LQTFGFDPQWGEVLRNDIRSQSLPHIAAGVVGKFFPIRILALEPGEKVPLTDDYAIFRRRTGNDL
jgi:hypothetical protein